MIALEPESACALCMWYVSFEIVLKFWLWQISNKSRLNLMEDASGIKFKDARLPNKELILSNI